MHVPPSIFENFNWSTTPKANSKIQWDKVVVRNLRHYGNRLITPPHGYIWSFLRGKSISTSPSLNSLLLTPSLHKSHLLSNTKTPENILDLIPIKTTQFTPPIKILYHFWNQIIPQRFLTTTNTFTYRHITTWVVILVKGCLLSVTSHGCLTAASEMILVGIFTKK